MINEDMNQVLANFKAEIFRDLRVASVCKVVATANGRVDVQPLVADVTGYVAVPPPVVKGLFAVGSGSLPSVGTLGIMLHLDRKNVPYDGMQISGGPAHDINHGVFLPLIV